MEKTITVKWIRSGIGRTNDQKETIRGLGFKHQLALPAGGASYEEILLRQQQLATGYDYSFSVGLNFSFGSTRSQVVNPRFGNGGRSISIGM